MLINRQVTRSTTPNGTHFMTQPKRTPKEIADQLLNAHVQHELAAFNEDKFMAWARDESEALFSWLNTITLNDIVTKESIKSVVHINVVERNVPGSVAEIAGEAATHLFNANFNIGTKLSDIMTNHQFEEWVDKALELHEQRRRGLNRLIDLPIYTDLISDVIYQAITRYIYETNILSKKVPGVSSMLKFGKKMVDKAAPKLEGALEENIKNYIADNLAFLIRESKSFLENSLTDEQIKQSAMDIWDSLSTKTLGELQEGMSSLDLTEFVVLGYEFWLRFRKTNYFKHCYELVIDYFYEKYGDSALTLLLEDFNISPERAIEEVSLFAPQALKVLTESGQLEKMLRRRLASFYESSTALSLL